jgi:hypothetical protein
VKIGFTGHRDKIADPNWLSELYDEFPLSTWGHGNAKDGFDKQVDEFVMWGRIPCVRFPPLPEVIATKGYVGALLERNIELVDWLDGLDDLLVALYDGRTYGGTYRTVTNAKRKNKIVREWKV